jgi:4-hydroxybenzoate polyprenyltransferase
MKNKLIAFMITWALASSAYAQEVDPAYQHRVPDKVFELGIPVLLIISILYTITQLFRISADKKIKEKLIEKGISDETLILLTRNGNRRLRLEALKWGLILGYTGIAFLLSEFTVFGFMTFAFLFLGAAAALVTFYLVTKNEH